MEKMTLEEAVKILENGKTSIKLISDCADSEYLGQAFNIIIDNAKYGHTRPEPKQTSSGLTAFEYTRLISWMKDLNREPAITAFTSGACRDAGRAFEKYLGGGRDERADS